MTVQQSIPIDAIYKDGIFRTGRLFSKSWKFSDINYAVASDDDQLQMFLVHSAILNGLPTDAMAEIVMYLYLYRYIVFFALCGLRVLLQPLFLYPKHRKERRFMKKMTEKLFELAYTDSMTGSAKSQRLKKLRKPQTAL